MKYNISDSARIAGVTRKTLYKHIDKKPITVEQDLNGSPAIDASELIRVYGDKCNFDLDTPKEETGPTEKDKREDTRRSTNETVSVAVLEKEVEMLRIQMTSERQTLEDQIDYLKDKLDESTWETRKLTALLTDQSNKAEEGARSLEDRFQDLLRRISSTTPRTGSNDSSVPVTHPTRSLHSSLVIL